MSAFLRDLESRGRLDDVLVMCFSEFGRRVAENADRGTDHGTAEPILLLGGAIKPGLVGPPPNLDDLVDGDLQWQIDFRSVYASVLDEWLELPHREVLGHRFATLGLIRGTAPTAGDAPPPAPPGGEGPAPLEMMGSASADGAQVLVPVAPTPP